MDCKRANELIDLRVHELKLGARGADLSNEQVSEWSALEAHLEACPRCRSEFEELRRVRQLLTEAGGDRPDDTEVAHMWAAIQAGGSVHYGTDAGESGGSGGAVRGWWKRNRATIVSMTGVAAVLMVAFMLGRVRYGAPIFYGFQVPSIFGGVTDAARRQMAMSNIKASATSSRVYEANDPTGWGIPVHPRQYAQGNQPTDEPVFVGALEWKSPSSGVGGRDQAEELAAAQASPPLPARRRPSSRPNESAEARADMLFGLPASSASESQKKKLPPPGLPLGSKKVTVYTDPEPNVIVEGGAELSPASWMDEVKNDRSTYGLEILNAQQPTTAGSEAPLGNKAAEGHAATQASNAPENLKIIKTGEVTIEVADNAKSVGQVERIATDGGGFVADIVTREEAGGALTSRIILRVPPAQFEDTFAALKAIGRVESENVKVADVTAEYVDLEARIHSLKITEERLRELIANKSFVDKISALLEVEREMNRVRTQIEQFQGQLRVMADRVSLSTIVVTLREPARTVPSASLSVEVAALDRSADAIGDMLADSGGRLLSGKTSKRGDGTLMGEYQLETTLSRFAEVIGAIEGLGRVEQRQVSDQQFGNANEPWAEKVPCHVALVLFERSRQMPSGNVHVEVDTLDEAMKELGKILAAHEATMVSNQATRHQAGSNSASIQVRVPAGRFAALLDAMEPLGRVLAKSVSGETESIEGGAAVVPCNLSLTLAERAREVPRGSLVVEVETFDPAREALSKAIAARKVQVLNSSSNQRTDGTWLGSFRLGVPAKEMEPFVSAVCGLGRVVNRQISGIGLGDLSSVDPESIGVIDLMLGEKSALSPAPDQTSASIRGKIRDGLAGFYSSIGMIAYGLVVLAPWLVLAVVLWFVVSRVRRIFQKRKVVEVLAG